MTSSFSVVHHEVYQKPGEFAGWPANYGLWCWRDELLAIFVRGELGKPTGNIHREDRNHPFVPMQARSLDGGVSWSVEEFPGHVPGVSSLSADEHVNPRLKADGKIDPEADFAALEVPLNFSDPETMVLAARTGLSGCTDSWFYVSQDRAHTWAGPFAFTGLDVSHGLCTRTDIVSLAQHDALFLLTSPKSNGEEGCVLCARTTDGGRNFYVEGVVWDKADGYAIMPASVQLSGGRIFTVIRRGTQNKGSLEGYCSDDLGRSWHFCGVPVANTGYMGNPPALTVLSDARLVLLYGFRDEPFGIRFVVSDDDGLSWSEPHTLRDDAGGPDLGYPRAVVRPDGKIVVVYYFNQRQAPERFIVASILDLPAG